LAHHLSALGDKKGQMNGPKVLDEVICKTLRGPSSDAMFHDIVISGQDVFYTTNCGANISVMCWRSLTRGEERVETRGFSSEPQPHYIPLWMEMCDATEYSSLQVYMSSQINTYSSSSANRKRRLKKNHSTLFSLCLIFTGFNCC
jgi:hypothetical protein